MATNIARFLYKRGKVFWGTTAAVAWIGWYDPVSYFHMRPYAVFNYSDNRQTAYLDRGSKDPDATVILYFHDSLGSRFETELFGSRKLLPSSMLRSAGIRMITLERDGIGESYTRNSYEKRFAVASFARDIDEFCRGTNISKFHSIGYGNGAAFALASGRLSKCESVTMINSVEPYAEQEPVDDAPWSVRIKQRMLHFPFYRSNPLTIWLHQIPHILMFRLPFIYFRIWERIGYQPGSPDAALMSGLIKDRFQSEFISNHKECFRQSVVPYIEDKWLTQYQSWDLDFSRVRCPVNILRGGKDPKCTAQWCQWLADRLPNTKLVEYPDDGHLSLPVNHFVDIVLDLVNDSNDTLMDQIISDV